MYLKSMVKFLPRGKTVPLSHSADAQGDEYERETWRSWFEELAKSPPASGTLGARIAMLWAKPKGVQLDVVELPKPEDDVPPEWRHIQFPDKPPQSGAVLGMLWAVIATMHDFRDDTQAALPGYRERVAQVRLMSNQGGFNLNMERKTIEAVAKKGETAGDEFRKQFSMSHHQWVRLRLLVMEFKEKFGQLAKIGLVRPGTFPALVDDQKQAQSGFPYQKPDTTWCDEFLALLAALQQAVTQWGLLKQDVAFHTGEPPPVMRITPKM
jgi:hypothetical protein